MTRTYTLDEPRPAWLAPTERTLAYLPIAPEQVCAARQLIRGLEAELPEPSVATGVVCGRMVAGLMWCNGGRAVLAQPVLIVPPACLQARARLLADLTIWSDGKELWSGMRHAPVPLLRGMLGWVYREHHP